jgi:hypothetical protein
MIKAVVTGDIIDSTKLGEEENSQLIQGLKLIIDDFEKDQLLKGEMFRGDSLQCLIYNPSDALKITLLIKTFVKGIVSINNSKEKIDAYKLISKSVFDIRLAIGIGEINGKKESLSMSQGEAFNLSGRLIDEMKHKQTIAIRTNDVFNNELDTSFKLLDFILSNATQNQCEVIYYKLQGLTEVEISEKIGVNQSAVNQRSNSSGWSAINSLIQRFESIYA